ncbi:MAG: type II toxin-antitoxin system Phd/YefM family antitoxin [Clostridiales bacterium]|jgi:prevent-host-death family protein|nr:type II toxin-antitoxin system Phd/YefM family antitoxin [Clostridiales bacterium]
MTVNSTEFQNNVGRFLQKAADEDIVITRNGKEVARLIGAGKAATFLTDSLIGILPEQIDASAEKSKYFEEKYGV